MQTHTLRFPPPFVCAILRGHEVVAVLKRLYGANFNKKSYYKKKINETLQVVVEVASKKNVN